MQRKQIFFFSHLLNLLYYLFCNQFYIYNSVLVGSDVNRNLSSQHFITNCNIDAEWRIHTMATTADAITQQSRWVRNVSLLVRARRWNFYIADHFPQSPSSSNAEGWRSAWCLSGINSLILGSLWCLQRNVMNNSEVHVAVIAPTNRHTYALPTLPVHAHVLQAVTRICTYINTKLHTCWHVLNTSLRNMH